MSRTISLSSSLLSLVLVLINSSPISSQTYDQYDQYDSDTSDTKAVQDPREANNIVIWLSIVAGIGLMISILIMIINYVRNLKEKELVKPDELTCRNTLNNRNISAINGEELDLENNWITDVYINNQKDNNKKKLKFYNIDNDSLQSVQLSSEEKHPQQPSSKVTKSSNLSNVITLPPFAYHPSSPTLDPALHLNVNTSSTKDLSEKALEYLANNPPKDVLPSQAEIHSIIKVHEDSYLNPYSPWKFIVEKSVIEESGIVQITNYGKLVEINTRKWSSITNDVCVQSNYPFFVPKPSSVRRNSISTPADRFKDNNNQVKRNSSNAIKPIPREEVIHYFEVTVLSIASDVDTTISIGLTTKPYPYFRLPGWNKYSVGYQSNNGQIYHNDVSSGKEYAPTFAVGDTIGCGYKPGTNEIFFTKNGDYLGPYITTKNPFISHDTDNSLQHVWYPTIAASGQCKLEINFGGEIGENAKDLFRYKLARNFGPGAPLSIVKQLRNGELVGCHKKSKSENVELERVGLK